MQDCGRDALEWALFAQQYHLPLLEAEAVHHIVQNFVEAERQEGFNELGQGVLRRITHGLAQEMSQPGRPMRPPKGFFPRPPTYPHPLSLSDG